MANNDQNSTKQTQVTVIIVPFPAQSHLNQLLQLSCLISSYKIQVHYISSAIHNHQLKIRAQGRFNPQHINNINFHDLPVPQFQSPDPDPALVFPEHMIPSFEAFLHMCEPVSKLLKELSSTSKRIIIIHDSACGSVVQDACSIDNAERYAFNGISAFTTFFFTCEAIGKLPSDLKVEIPEKEKIPSLEGCFSFEMMNLMAHQYDFQKYKAGDLYNTCRLMEGTYVDLLAKLEDNSDHEKKKKKQWAIGPLHLHMLNIFNHKKINSDQDKCLKWLDKQGPKSVIYISFGTTTTLSDEQIKELASGLEASKVKFIWVLREADRGDIFTGIARRQELPEGFEDRVEGMGMGMVVRDYWAPQIEILGHTSTGGFMSHCGWNSCMESISMGVPIAAWPMHSDQPQNAVLITELLKVGVIGREWECRRKLLMSSSIENVVTRLMITEEGKQMRERAQELGNKLRKATEEGGISHVEMDSFIAHITR